MSAVGRIQAAIDKLTELKAQATPGPWTDTFGSATVPAADDLGWDDIALIVTLHRTIDAQLAILNDGLLVAKHWEDVLEKVSGSVRIPITHALLFANAILGADS